MMQRATVGGGRFCDSLIIALSGSLAVAPPDPGVLYVRCKVARAWGEVGPTPGITVIAAPGAAAAAVMPGVCPGYFHIWT